jgi:7-keto-8-aminopelargonate synthetase-like enzyme
VVATLVRPGDIVVSDSLNHASIIDGCRLARADVRVFPHGSVDALAELLPVAAADAARQGLRVVLALDGVYSMDGDVAPLPAMARLARNYEAIVLLDDAHGFATLGHSGRGAAELLGAEDGVDVHIGTLGKALGSFGAFVAGSSRLRDLLVNAARTFLFTCALSPPQVAAARAALRIVQAEPLRRTRLQGNAARLRARLAAHGIATAPSATHIVPVIVGDNESTMQLSERLLDRGYFAQGIRHPSVPHATARLRLTLMATHSAEEIDALAEAVAEELPRAIERRPGERSADPERR